MSNINLLPWRENQRAKKNRMWLFASFVLWVACAIAGFLVLQGLNSSLSYQRERNQFMTHENAKLKRTIADIQRLQVEKQKLVERVEVIQNLRQDRMHIVHVFEDIVRKLPAGITLDKMTKKDREIHLQGRAKSNARVSELMNEVESSQFFGRSNLHIVALKDSSSNELREFEVVLTEAHRNATNKGLK